MVTPVVETFALDEATRAFDRLVSGDMRFRGVFTPARG
jgi:D-arabinose 1-dehydrogenase-like Zn-dependent alcohol dehydrogenase